MKKIVILGSPGSGKTTKTREIIENAGYLLISAQSVCVSTQINPPLKEHTKFLVFQCEMSEKDFRKIVETEEWLVNEKHKQTKLISPKVIIEMPLTYDEFIEKFPFAHFAENLTVIQCQAVGGVYTSFECISTERPKDEPNNTIIYKAVRREQVAEDIFQLVNKINRKLKEAQSLDMAVDLDFLDSNQKINCSISYPYKPQKTAI